MGPIAQHCPVEGSAAPWAPRAPALYHRARHHHVLPAAPCPSAIFREKETKGSKSGGGGLASPTPLSPYPLLPSPERRCSYQKRLLKDDLFYFSLTLFLGKKEKKMTKPTIKDQKKKIRKPPPNPQQVMFFSYP